MISDFLDDFTYRMAQNFDGGNCDEWAYGKFLRKKLTNSIMLTPAFINGRRD